MNEKKECFLICPIGMDDSPDRKRSDALLKHLISPIADEAGYRVTRADLMSEGGIISTQILNKVIETPLVIADLTNSNPNVFYELAIRHATNKPYIQLIQKDQKIPFDVSGVRTIYYDLSDLDAVEKTKHEIARQIKSIESGHRPDSPVSLAGKNDIVTMPDNVLQVFLEKFWNLEEDVGAISGDVKILLEHNESDLEYLVERIVEDKLSDACEKIIDAIKEKA